MQLFYAPDISVNLELPEEESGHCARVLRLREGDEILITDGKGLFYKALLTSVHPKHCGVEVLESWTQPPLWKGNVHIAVAPTKHMDRMEWFVEKATEIGVDAITFLNCRFSERREIKVPRVEKIMVSAMKQSQKASLPVITGMTDFKDFIRSPFAGQKFIAHCEDEEKYVLGNCYHPGDDVVVLIGPEGDFSPEEIKQAQENGFVGVSLGASRLRTETAALVACHTIQLLQAK